MKDNYENSPSNSLFHFTRFETAIEHILPNLKLRVSSIINTNDPREYKSFGFGAFNPNFSKGEEIKQQIKWNQRITNLLRKGIKVLCFSQDYQHNDEWFDGYNLPRMWAQYGGNHAGVCLEIDKELFIEENSELFSSAYLKPISYTIDSDYPFVNFDRINSIGLEPYINEFRINNLDHLFFEKFVDWEAEREVRLLYLSNKEDKNEFFSIDKSLKRIIVGCEFNHVYLPSLLILYKKGIKLDQIKYEHGAFKSFQFRDEYLKGLIL